MRATLDQILGALGDARMLTRASARARAEPAGGGLRWRFDRQPHRGAGRAVRRAARRALRRARFPAAGGAQGGRRRRGKTAGGLDPPAALAVILVPDTLAALGQIARWWRSQFDLPVIGVTGSNGKTTVKEMIAAILAAAHGEEDRLATRGNLNNEIGVPLTLFRLAPHHSSAVIELGMNHPGEIGRLARIAAPTIALVNNAQREHQEFMHTVEAVARENGAALAALPGDGTAVFPSHDEFTPIWRELAGGRRTITFGLTKEADVSCTFRAADFGNQMFVSIRCSDGELVQFYVGLQAAGEHNVRNALAAVACTAAAGISPTQIKLGSTALRRSAAGCKRRPPRMAPSSSTTRTTRTRIRCAPRSTCWPMPPRRACWCWAIWAKWAPRASEFHEEIAAYAAQQGHRTGARDGRRWPAYGCRGRMNTRHFEQFDALLAAVDAAVTPGTTVLIKGSRFMKMERVVQHLIGSQQANKDNPLIMLLWLAQYLQDDIGAFRVFNFITFRAVFATITALLIGLFAGPAVIRKLTAMKYGQAVRTDGPQTHLKKHGTPNHGRRAAADRCRRVHRAVVRLVEPPDLAGDGGDHRLRPVGWVDDYRKVVRQDPEGMRSAEKYFWQSLVGIGAALYLAFSVSAPTPVEVFNLFFPGCSRASRWTCRRRPT
jgi:UDP-N-acetylmuramoyl-tripeptide--D-alanyl-D-alanine ligase